MRSRLIARLIVSATIFSALTAIGCHAPSDRLKAVLWVGGFAHDYDAIAATMTEDLSRRLPVDIDVVRDGSFLDSSGAGGLDVIVMNHCYKSAEGILNEAQKQQLLDLIHGGVGVVAIHASYYSFLEWEAYHDVFGAQWIRHGPSDALLVLRTVDHQHPITRNLPDSFELVSELYESTPLSPDCRVLVMARDTSGGPEHPSTWVRMYGKGRIATILPGHLPENYKVEGFQKLIAAATRWAAKAN